MRYIFGVFCIPCQTDLDWVNDSNLTFHRCRSCRCTFLDQDNFNQLLCGLSESPVDFFDLTEDAIKRDDKRRCPDCLDANMQKKGVSEFSEIIIDECPGCGGVLLDSNEHINMAREAVKRMPKNPNLASENTLYGPKFEEVVSYGVGVGTTGDRGTGSQATAVDYAYVRFSVFFSEDLGLGLNMYREKWTDKLAKSFGLSRKQDIVIGDKQLDAEYMIQGYYPEDIKMLLSDKDVKSSIKRLSGLRLESFNLTGRFKIGDECVTYSEGPYHSHSGNEVTFADSINPEADKSAMTDVVMAVEGYYAAKSL